MLIEDFCNAISVQNVKLSFWKTQKDFSNQDVYYCSACNSYEGSNKLLKTEIDDPDQRKIDDDEETRKKVIRLCGECHSVVDYIGHYNLMVSEITRQIAYLESCLRWLMGE